MKTEALAVAFRLLILDQVVSQAAEIPPPTVQAIKGRTVERMDIKFQTSGQVDVLMSVDLKTWETLVRYPMPNPGGINIGMPSPGFYRAQLWKLPKWTTSIADRTVLEGGDINIDANATGYADIQIQWMHDAPNPRAGYPPIDIEVNGAVGPYLRLRGVSTNDTGRYWAIARVPGTEFRSESCVVRVIESYAPGAIAGHEILASIQDGEQPFVREGTYTIRFASFDGTYQLIGNFGIPDSHGVFTYARTGAASSLTSWSDYLLDVGSTIMTWENEKKGTFEHRRNDGIGWQRGSFQLTK